MFIQKYFIGLILSSIFTLVLRDNPKSLERFTDLTSEWLNEDQAADLYRFLRSWFYEDITFDGPVFPRALNVEESQSFPQNSEKGDIDAYKT